jgi:hypothetical protein
MRIDELSTFLRMLEHECPGYTEDAATFLQVLFELTLARDACLLTGGPIAIVLLGPSAPANETDVM